MRRLAAHVLWTLATLFAICVSVSTPAFADEKPAATPAKADDKSATIEKKPVSYHADVLPILQANCQGCHQPAKAGGKLDMTSFKNLLTAGESGSKAVVAGKPAESYLLEQIVPTKGEAAMPKDKPPLSAADIAQVRRW